MQKIITLATVLTLVTFSACTKNASETNTNSPATMGAADAPLTMDTSATMATPKKAPANPPAGSVGASTSTSTHMGTSSDAAKAAPTDNSESNRTYPNNDMGGDAKKPKH